MSMKQPNNKEGEMDILKITEEAGQLLNFLNQRELRPDEKIAALDAAAGVIRGVLNAESFRVMMANLLRPR